MGHYLNRTFILLMLYTTTVALTGCLEGSTAAAPDPGPNPTNNAPTISGNPPAAVIVGNNYSFTPTASDPDVGDTLSFSIQNKPVWADFDTATGTLSGVAVQGSEGIYANIQITVSDGDLSASMPQFAVEVTQVALGSAALSWTAPTQNTDGSPLTDLAAYKIYYGNSPGSYPNQIQIDNPGITTYVVENLVPDTYFFVATSINSMGIESDFSNSVSKTVN
jgi:hypothetical protein